MATKTVFVFDETTGIYISRYEAQEYPPDSGDFITPTCHLEVDPGSCPDGKVWVAQDGAWLAMDNFMGAVIYDQAGTDTRLVNMPGPIPEGWAVTPPPPPPPTAEELAAAAEMQHADELAAAADRKNSLLATAGAQISILTDATDPDVVSEVSANDTALLLLWKKYRQDLRGTDATALPVAWPAAPASASGT